MPKITKRAVDALIPDPNRDLQMMDTELIGFGVRMKPSGAAAYFVRYRTPDGGSRRLVIGKVGTLTPEEARKLARGKLSAVAAGADPSGERHKAREAMTLAEVCDYGKIAPLLLPLPRHLPCQFLQLHSFRLRALQDRLLNIRRQQGEPQQPVSPRPDTTIILRAKMKRTDASRDTGRYARSSNSS